MGVQTSDTHRNTNQNEIFIITGIPRLQPGPESHWIPGSQVWISGGISIRTSSWSSSVGAEATASVQTSTQDQCCCIAADQDCFDLYNVEDDLVGQGLIDPRIVNRPPAQPSPLHSTCPAGYKTCCYAPDLDLSVFQRNHQCISPLAASSQQLNTQHSVYWSQGCQETPVYGSKQCGTRNYPGPVPGLSHGQSHPESSPGPAS